MGRELKEHPTGNMCLDSQRIRCPGAGSNACFCFAGEFVAQFKFTVLLMPNGPMRITSGPFEPELYKSEFEVQDGELKVSLKKTQGASASRGLPCVSAPWGEGGK